MNSKTHLEYKSLLKPDYTENYLEIIYDKDKNLFETIYFYNWEHGTIKLENGKKVMRRWEEESEAQTGSYLKRHYPVICLNGVTYDTDTENKIIEENMKYVKSINTKPEEMEIINNAIILLKHTKENM